MPSVYVISHIDGILQLTSGMAGSRFWMFPVVSTSKHVADSVGLSGSGIRIWFLAFFWHKWPDPGNHLKIHIFDLLSVQAKASLKYCGNVRQSTLLKFIAVPTKDLRYPCLSM